MKHVDIYTDGACSGNPGKGGWCAILICEGNEKPLSGGEAQTTNNRMEVYAAIAGLSALKKEFNGTVSLYSDSAYLVNAVQLKWLDNWRKRGWKTADNKPVKNKDLWEILSALLSERDVTFIKVKGHADNVYNNRCDELARAEIAKPE